MKARLFADCVSILVILELALEEPRKRFPGSPKEVSILVILELALEVESAGTSFMVAPVSILVILELALEESERERAVVTT